MRVLRLWAAVTLLALPIMAQAQAQPQTQPRVSVADTEPGYRQIQIDVAVSPDPRVAAYEIWFAENSFSSTRDALLHSRIAVMDVDGLERGAPGENYDYCQVDGLPAYLDADGNAVIDRNAARWSCALTGMVPGRDTWIAVVPVSADGLALVDVDGLQPVSGRTDASDERTPPPDTRPVLYALGSIILSTIVLLVFLRQRDARKGRTRSRLAHVYVAPAVIGLITLTFYPILYGIGLAFTDADQSHLGDEAWVGLKNFVTVFASPGMWRVTGFTLVWAIANTAAHVFFGLLLALALNRAGLTGKTVYRTVFLLPWAIPGYISVLAWNGMLQPEGLVNGVLGTSIDFLAGADSARLVVILVNIWLGIPFMMMTLSGALQALSADMFEAAEVDGVSRWDQFRYLTLPNLKSTMVPVSLLGFIWSFNSFNTIYLMTRGNPYVGFGEPGATDILITYVFSVAFEYGQYGVAAAWSVLIFLMLVVFSWLYLKKTRATEASA